LNRKRLIILIAVIVLVASLNALELWQIQSLRKRVSNTEWSDAYETKAQEDSITPEVGVIQFLKRGYSIEIDSASYTADGLKLHGFVGNPLNLTVSNLSLKFSVTKPLYAYRDDFAKDEWILIVGPPPIGEAQTSPIYSLIPRERAPFDVTIPNVKQTKDGIQIHVSFSGERYTYSY
jgi:hypothetical protein